MEPNGTKHTGGGDGTENEGAVGDSSEASVNGGGSGGMDVVGMVPSLAAAAIPVLYRRARVGPRLLGKEVSCYYFRCVRVFNMMLSGKGTWRAGKGGAGGDSLRREEFNRSLTHRSRNSLPIVKRCIAYLFLLFIEVSLLLLGAGCV